ncbi:unnamed protein product [Hymenolepis diminuta]|uniref:Uncharacterized protein n=1 Tax=Hymenolepis diminuta TaxID=6216 RepID=A0A564YB12_HYMDI|nr:unnamed protein product [Hymenolepis diminuta]
MVGLPDYTRITMLFRKFNKGDHGPYLVCLFPLLPKDLTRYKCLNLAIREGEDIHKYIATGLRPVWYAEIRLNLMSVLDKNPDVMLYHLMDEYNNFRSPIAN